MKQRLPDPANTVLFVGFQAQGTRGRDLVEGQESIRMFGTNIPVRANIVSIDGFSGHADYNEMLAWLMAFNKRAQGIPRPWRKRRIRSLRQTYSSEFGWTPILPKSNNDSKSIFNLVTPKFAIPR